jgi:two-component system phosphate regulon sensor histidine kinase PhoR
LNRRVFGKLLGLFSALLALEAVVGGVSFVLLLRGQFDGEFLLRPMVFGGLAAVAVCVPLAAWAAGSISRRFTRVVEFAHRIAAGDLKARLGKGRDDELSGMETALNQTAERLGAAFTESERRRQELAAMLDAMQEAVIAVTAEGAVGWTNAVMQRIAGAQIRVGRPLVHTVRDPDLLDCVKQALESGEVRFGRSSSLAPGKVFEVSAAPLPQGGALAVLHDVTRIEAAEKTRRDFIANVSHELRTPLTSIQGYVETLLDEPKPRAEIEREFLGVILKNATRMNRLTEDLLALASVESPDYKLSPRPVAASGLVHDAIQSLAGVVMDSGVALESDGAPERLVVADPDVVHQVFGNLVENALKYGKGGTRIVVGATEEEDRVVFTVRDFGPGIASEHQKRIFERFYRVDKARSRESGGTGLGLAIVKHLIEAHGGRVWVESVLGQGAAFRFTLPLAPAAEIAPQSQSGADGEAGACSL